MNIRRITFFFAATSLLSGCNLDIAIEGEGRVFSQDGTIDCNTSCRDINHGTPKFATLSAQAADGFTFLGFMPSGSETSEVSYGLVPITHTPYELPRYLQTFNASARAVFFPTDQIAQHESSGRGTCVVDTQQHMTCWGAGRTLHPKGLDDVSLLTRTGNNFCAYFNDRISCWNDVFPFSADAPASVINPITTASTARSTCILYQPTTRNAIHCLGFIPPAPELDNPSAIWSDGDHTYCATDTNGSHCWGNNF